MRQSATDLHGKLCSTNGQINDHQASTIAVAAVIRRQGLYVVRAYVRCDNGLK